MTTAAWANPARAHMETQISGTPFAVTSLARTAAARPCSDIVGRPGAATMWMSTRRTPSASPVPNALAHASLAANSIARCMAEPTAGVAASSFGAKTRSSKRSPKRRNDLSMRTTATISFPNPTILPAPRCVGATKERFNAEPRCRPLPIIKFADRNREHRWTRLRQHLFDSDLHWQSKPHRSLYRSRADGLSMLRQNGVPPFRSKTSAQTLSPRPIRRAPNHLPNSLSFGLA